MVDWVAADGEGTEEIFQGIEDGWPQAEPSMSQVPGGDVGDLSFVRFMSAFEEFDCQRLFKPNWRRTADRRCRSFGISRSQSAS